MNIFRARIIGIEERTVKCRNVFIWIHAKKFLRVRMSESQPYNIHSLRRPSLSSLHLIYKFQAKVRIREVTAFTSIGKSLHEQTKMFEYLGSEKLYPSRLQWLISSRCSVPR